MVAINLKLSKEREYEMKIARVVGTALPWGYKKRFFINLCRSVIDPDMSDEDARARVVRIVEEGIQAVSSYSSASEREAGSGRDDETRGGVNAASDDVDAETAPDAEHVKQPESAATHEVAIDDTTTEQPLPSSSTQVAPATAPPPSPSIGSMFRVG